MVSMHHSLGTFKQVYLFLDYYREQEGAPLVLRKNCSYPEGLELEVVQETAFGEHSVVKIARIVDYPDSANALLQSFKLETSAIKDSDQREHVYWSLWGAYLP